MELDEFAVVPDVDSVDAGRMRFEVSNAGELAHNLRVIRTDVAPGDLPVEGAGVDEGASALTVVARIKLLQPKQTRILTARLTPGTYVLICNVPGHYQSGMRATLEVGS